MKKSNFNASVEIKNDIHIIYVKGYLDAHTAPFLEKTINEIIKSGNFKIIVNFKDLNYISSAGLGVFMGFIEECRDNKGDIKMCELQKNVYTIFDLLGFPLLYDIDKEMTASINKFENPDSNINSNNNL